MRRGTGGDSVRRVSARSALVHINPDHFLQTAAGRVVSAERNALAWQHAYAALDAALAAATPASRLYLLIGAQGSGKSRWARERAQADPAALLFDAILVQRHERAPLLQRAARARVPAIAVWLKTPLHACLARNAARPPDEAADEQGLRNVFAALQPPTLDEGFAAIIEVDAAAPVPMRTLDDERVRLEPQTLAHADAMFEVLCDPAIYEHENQPPPSLPWLRRRFARLESRRSGDGSQRWLNWVIRLKDSGELAGYVQATLHAGSARAAIAYELNSRYWGRGLASAAVALMLRELAGKYGVHELSAVLKRGNLRSLKLLQRLGFEPGPDALRERWQVEPDELLMTRCAQPPPLPSQGRGSG